MDEQREAKGDAEKDVRGASPARPRGACGCGLRSGYMGRQGRRQFRSYCDLPLEAQPHRPMERGLQEGQGEKRVCRRAGAVP